MLVAVVAALGVIPLTLASAATSAAPAVTTAAATNITNTGAILHGTVNPEGQQSQYAFQWGPTAGYGHETTLTSAGGGSAASAGSATLTGLAPGSAYHFRTIAINVAGATSVGADQSFITTGTAPAPTTAPLATTSSVTQLGPSSATLNGTVNPQAQATTDYFEYGPTANYGFETSPVNAGAGTTNTAASANITGLKSGTAYHARIVAVSAGGTTLGGDQTLTTLSPPIALTGGASKPDASSVILSATVNPQGLATSYYFQFGTTTAYGLQTVPVSVGSGAANVAVHRHPQGLLANTTYHYRVVAQSAGGTTYGADRTVKTTGPSHLPSRLAVLGRMGFVSPGGWIGVIVGCFAGDTRCTGHFSLTRGHMFLAQRNFSVAPHNGGSQNVRLSARGRRLFGRRYHGPVFAEVNITTTSGQHISEAISLARWR
jgi:trimeric autotransporter adhesin